MTGQITARTLSGRVVNKMDKTIVVRSSWVKHPVRQIIKRGARCTHDENNECNIGDTVTVIESSAVKDQSFNLVASMTQRTGLRRQLDDPD